MNNGFPGSFTPVDNNKGVTCQPNFNGPQPGHCVLHHVDAAPVPNISRQIASAQNSGMNFLMAAQNQQAMARFSQQQHSQIAAAKSITAMVARLADEAAKNKASAPAVKPAAKTPAPAAKPAAKASDPAAKPAAKAPAPAAKPAAKTPAPAAKPAAKTPAPAAKPAAKASAPAVKPAAKTPAPAEKPAAKASAPATKPAAKAPAPAAKPAAKASAPATKPAAKTPAPAAKPAANPPVQKSDNSLLSTLASHNFLSNEQQAQKSKEIAECQTALCKIGKEAQWAVTDLTQGASFAAGIVAGVPAGLYETVDGIVKTASNPAEAYSALKTLSDSGNILENLASAVKQSWIDRIDRMEAEYQKGSISGAFNAGVEGGKLTTDIGGLVTGGAGLVKSGVAATEKAIVKVTGKVDSVAKTGADVALPPASAPERMAEYMAPKVVPDTSEAAKLALKNSPYLTIPPLDNPFLGRGLVDKLTFATPQQTKIAEQLLDIGIKASITGITAMTLKDVADRITADELTHITALNRAGNPSITGDYLSSLQDKYAPAHTGNTQLPDTVLRNTGGQPLAPQLPSHTGNPQISGLGVLHTGNTAGVTDTGIKVTITPIPDGPSMDDLAYLAGGRDNRLPIPEPVVASNGLKIESTTKHTPGAQGFRPNAGIEPRNSLDIFEHSIATKEPKIRLSIDSDGNIHRFFNTSKDGTGTFHWSGSTSEGENALGNKELGSFNKEIKELKGHK